MEHNSHTVEDCYELQFEIPKDYPASPPFVYETEGKIPKDFGHFMAGGNFCLGAPVEVRRRFAQHGSLIRFIEDQVIPYLFSYSYKRDHGELPFGELSHGTIGLIEYYNGFFGTSFIASLRLIKCLADGFAPPRMVCPCEGGRKLRDCHGPRLAALRPHLAPKQFETELQGMIEHARDAGLQLPESKVMPNQMWRRKQRGLRRKRCDRKRKRG